MSTNNPKVLLTYPGFKCSRPEWIGTLWGWRKWIRLDNMAYPVKVAAKADWVWRKKKSAEFYPHPKCFEEIVCALLPLYLPVILLEAFEDYRKAVLALPLPRPRILFSSNALHFNPTFQILMAEWRREGTHLLYHQHGGGYGLEPDMAVENYEIRVSDKFYSWGWQREGTAVLPLSPAMPEAKRNRLNGPVLLNCLDLPRAPYRLMFAPMPGTIDAMHRLTEDFLRGLPDVVKLTIRPYPVNYGWGAVERMYAAAPKARFDTSRVGLSRFFSASLVIHNYLGTSWLETLGFNIPTVCFFDPAIYIFRDNAQPYIDALRAVGVLHHSGADAARFVSGIAKDIGGWWQKPDVQQARFEFTQHYANFRPDWAMQWEAEFKKWLD
jgi:putative transferase (TIGR04331 family)